MAGFLFAHSAASERRDHCSPRRLFACPGLQWEGLGSAIGEIATLAANLFKMLTTASHALRSVWVRFDECGVAKHRPIPFHPFLSGNTTIKAQTPFHPSSSNLP